MTAGMWWAEGTNCPMTVRLLSNNCPMTVQCLSNDCPMTVINSATKIEMAQNMIEKPIP